jgi:hypothetical protein
MSDSVTCPMAADGERVHRYIAGTLELDAVAEFETHLLGCAECQAAVREGMAIAAALRRISAPAVALRRVPRRRLWWAVPIAAAAGTLWLIVGREGPLVKLGRVLDAPVFAGVAVRNDGDSVSRLADRGMAAYRDGRYSEAARLLGAVPEEERTSGLRFYLGIAFLLAGPQDAVLQLASVPAESPYSAEARFYRAKAWLLLGRADSALTHLTAIPSDAEAVGARARAADSVKEVSR